MKIYDMIKELYENEDKKFKVVGNDNNKIFKAQYFEGYKGAIMIDMGDEEIEMFAINETTMKQEYEEVKEPVNFFDWEEGKKYQRKPQSAIFYKEENRIYSDFDGQVNDSNIPICWFTDTEFFEV